MLACSVNRLTMKCRFPAPLVALGLALLFAAPLSAQPAIPDTAQSSPAPADALQGAQLLQALRAGGLVIYFRHTDTDFSRSDAGVGTGYGRRRRDAAPDRPGPGGGRAGRARRRA